MAWVKFDDGYADHRKVAGLTDAAFRLHTAGILYCGRHLTDGLIEGAEVPRLVRRFRPKALTELVEGGLWVPLMDGGLFRIHDYLDWNDTAEVVKARRDAAARRKADYLAKKGKGTA
jgi:hypothetical protein